MAKQALEAPFFSTFESVPGPIIGAETHAYTVLGLDRASTWTLPDERWNSEQWKLLCSFSRWTEAGYPHEAKRTIVTNRNFAARQCPSACGQQDIWDQLRFEIWTPETSSLQSGPRA